MLASRSKIVQNIIIQQKNRSTMKLFKTELVNNEIIENEIIQNETQALRLYRYHKKREQTNTGLSPLRETQFTL